MDILSNYNQTLEKFENTLQSTKHLLAKLEALVNISNIYIEFFLE